VETVARRGYRFIAPVNRNPAADPALPQERLPTPEPLAHSRLQLYWAGAVLCAASLLTGGGVVYWVNSSHVEPAIVEMLTYSGRDFSPAVSPDGKTVAFSSDRDGTPRIWLKQVKGGDEVALTSGPDRFPRFSPNGATILFSRRHGVHHSLYKVASVGGEPRKIIDDALDGDFSPDGRHIAFIRWKQENQRHISSIGVSAADGSDAAGIAELRDVRLDLPRWSPDGSAIATIGAPAAISGEIFVEVWLVRVDNKRLRRLRTLLPERGISSVVWRDKRTVIYTRGDRSTVTAELIAHDTAGDTFRRTSWRCCSLTLDKASPSGLVFDERATRSSLLELGRNDHAARWISHANSHDRQPVYSPDGKWIVFSSNRDGHMNLWQMSLETGTVSRLTEGNATNFDAAFSPDGKHLIFTSDRSSHFEIYVAARDGSGARQLTHTGVDAENATMTADGRWIVYASDIPGTGGIWKIHPDGTGAVQIMRGLASNPEVSPDGEYVLYLVNPQPHRAEIRVIRLSDGAEVPGSIQCWRRRENGVTLGRARWAPSPDGKAPLAIAFIDQDAAGATGVSIQDFVPGRDTSTTRKPLRPFDPLAPVETLGVSADGRRLIVSVADDMSSIMWVSHVPR
jgi:Tol biopolymer transport system component